MTDEEDAIEQEQDWLGNIVLSDAGGIYSAIKKDLIALTPTHTKDKALRKLQGQYDLKLLKAVANILEQKEELKWSG